MGYRKNGKVYILLGLQNELSNNSYMNSYQPYGATFSERVAEDWVEEYEDPKENRYATYDVVDLYV